jgi:hypothetical protein
MNDIFIIIFSKYRKKKKRCSRCDLIGLKYVNMSCTQIERFHIVTSVRGSVAEDRLFVY